MRTPGPIISNYEVWGDEDAAISIVIDKNPAMDVFEDDAPFWFKVDPAFSMIVGGDEERIVLKGMKPQLAEMAESCENIMIIEVDNREIVRCTPCRLKGTEDKYRPQPTEPPSPWASGGKVA